MRVPFDNEEGSLDVLAAPLGEVDVELVEGDVCSGDEDFLDEGVDALKNSEVEELGAVLVEIGHELPVLRHFGTANTNPRILRVGFGVWMCCVPESENGKGGMEWDGESEKKER